MKKVKFGELFDFLLKSKIKAGDGLTSGKYPLFTSSQQLTKYVDNYIYDAECLIFGTGGQASIHYYSGKFSTSTDCFVVSAKENSLDLKYVYLYLKSHMKILEEGFKGAGLKHISKKYISNIRIPLPDTLEEQRKIANLLTQVEDLIEKRNESIGLLDELLKSTFLDMFGDPVLNPKGWEVKPLKKFGNISTGNTPSRREEKYYNDNYIEWIKTDNILTNKMYLTKAKEYLSKEGLEKGRSIDAGALLVTCIAGSLKSIGNASLTNRKVAFNQQINAIEPFDDVNSLFLYWLVKISKNYIQDQAGKGMKKMITKSSFEKIKLPKPDYDLQDEFAKVVRQVETTKEYYQESLYELKELFGSLSQKAFKGELNSNAIWIRNWNDIDNIVMGLQVDEQRVKKEKSRDTENVKKLSLQKVSGITEREIIDILENSQKPLNLDGIIKEWHKRERRSTIHLKVMHYEIIKNRILDMIEKRMIVQINFYGEALLGLNNET